MTPPRANVYIDGFNFYYRHVKGTPYKWLNPARLSATLLPSATIHRIRYFTARVRSLPNNPDAPARQQIFLRALGTVPDLTVVFGEFQSKTVRMPLVNPQPGGVRFAEVIRTDEKGSDVNLATYLLMDAFKKDCDVALVISNDSDLAEPIRLAISEFGLEVGVALPKKKPSVTLTRVASFTRTIRTSALQTSLFPAEMRDDKGVFSTPPSW